MPKNKQSIKRGETWEGYYPRLTKTKAEKELAQRRKDKQRTKYMHEEY